MRGPALVQGLRQPRLEGVLRRQAQRRAGHERGEDVALVRVEGEGRRQEQPGARADPLDRRLREAVGAHVALLAHDPLRGPRAPRREDGVRDVARERQRQGGAPLVPVRRVQREERGRVEHLHRRAQPHRFRRGHVGGRDHHQRRAHGPRYVGDPGGRPEPQVHGDEPASGEAHGQAQAHLRQRRLRRGRGAEHHGPEPPAERAGGPPPQPPGGRLARGPQLAVADLAAARERQRRPAGGPPHRLRHQFQGARGPVHFFIPEDDRCVPLRSVQVPVASAHPRRSAAAAAARGHDAASGRAGLAPGPGARAACPRPEEDRGGAPVPGGVRPGGRRPAAGKPPSVPRPARLGSAAWPAPRGGPPASHPAVPVPVRQSSRSSNHPPSRRHESSPAPTPPPPTSMLPPPPYRLWLPSVPA